MTSHDTPRTSDAQTPSPADLRVAVRRWRRRHRATAAAALVIVTAVWIAVVWLLGDGAADGAPTLRAWLTVAASAAALTTIIGLAIGHLGTAGLRWPSHFVRLPVLALQVWRRSDRRTMPVAAGSAVGAVAALFLHPSVSLGGAAVLVGMSTTPVGEALAGWWRAGAEGRAAASGGPETMTTPVRRLLALSAGLGAALVAFVRWAALDPGCQLGYVLGGACDLPALGAAAVAIAAGLATVPIFVTLGALVSHTLDDEPLAPRRPSSAPAARGATAPTPVAGSPPGPLFERREELQASPRGADEAAAAPPTEGHRFAHDELPAVEGPTEPAAQDDEPPPPEPHVEEDPTLEVELVELAAEAALFEEARAEADGGVPGDEPASAAPAADAAAETASLEEVVASELEELSDEGRLTLAAFVRSVDPRDELEGDLGRRLAALPAGALSDALDRIRTSLPTLEALRAQYGRAPSLARAAIERTCVGGLRAAGIPDGDAVGLADGLLNLGRDDWQILRETMDRLDEHLDVRNA